MKVTLREKVLSDGRKSLYLDYYQDGKRKYEYLKIYLTKDKVQNRQLKELANAIRSKRELEIKNNEFGFDTKFKKQANFFDFFEKVADTKPTRAAIFRQAKRHLVMFHKADVLRFEEITPMFLEQWKAYLSTEITSNTARGLFSVVNLTLKQAVKQKIIPSNPCEQVEPPKFLNIKRDFLTREEIQRLADTACASSEAKRAFLFGCTTGLRLGDIRRLQWLNIQGEAIHITQEKTKEPLYIPLSLTAKKLLGETGEPESFVFAVPSDSHLSVILKTWVAQAGITKEITFHSSRHSFACLALENGVEIFTVSKLLGHSRLETTLVYLKLLDSKKREAINKLPEIEVSL
ncbi:MAG: site-specific integrase [Chlorobiales bacterium]|nr:site-specific integrase [Chlorobiales bacterium]